MKVIRVLVYEGPEGLIDRQMRGNLVKGSRILPNGIEVREYVSGYKYPEPSPRDLIDADNLLREAGEGGLL